ncbi:mycothione reductase [Nocardioides anomalus]|uniref:mycothione reductase n=1 Tax=Nocardioides anomalus TaxID=2712223 RepID=UPI001E5A3FC9|nr:mycothione reductase [Nocardioides anomalus]
MSDHYDVVVLGAGSGNMVIDERFATQRVAIVESGDFGGTCLNRGCIPSKMLVHTADLVRAAQRGPALGARTSAAGVDWPAVRDRVLARIGSERDEGEQGRDEDEYVDRIRGIARFVGERRLVVTGADGEREISADQVVVATGSRPQLPPVEGLEQSPHHTSDTVMHLAALPRRMAILGGGYVGCEFAHVFSAFGVEVTQIESGPRLLNGQDEELAERFTTAAGEQWTVRLGVEAERVVTEAGGVRMELSDGSAVETDLILVATGRVPNGDLLDLERAGIEVDDDGLVVVDAEQRTTAAGVWALGDVCQGAPLKHVANHEARVVQHNLLHPEGLRRSDHRTIPNAVFSHPPLAAVGLTEEQAREEGVEVAVGRAEYAGTAYGWALQAGPDDQGPDAGGLVKVIADRATGRLVGAHLLGVQASTLVQPLIQAVAAGTPAREVARGQYWIHPALTEVVEGALNDLVDRLDED